MTVRTSWMSFALSAVSLVAVSCSKSTEIHLRNQTSNTVGVIVEDTALWIEPEEETVFRLQDPEIWIVRACSARRYELIGPPLDYWDARWISQRRSASAHSRWEVASAQAKSGIPS